MQKDFQGWYSMMVARAPDAVVEQQQSSNLMAGAQQAIYSGDLDVGKGVWAASIGAAEAGTSPLDSAHGQNSPIRAAAQSAVRPNVSTQEAAAPAQPLTATGPGKEQDGTRSKGKYPKEVMDAAAPFLTGDATADEDILGFYNVRHTMLHGGT